MAKLNQVTNAEIRNLNDEELNDKINEEVYNLKKMKFSHAVNPIENPVAIRGIRRTIARLKTEQTQRKATTASN